MPVGFGQLRTRTSPLVLVKARSWRLLATLLLSGLLVSCAEGERATPTPKGGEKEAATAPAQASPPAQKAVSPSPAAKAASPFPAPAVRIASPSPSPEVEAVFTAVDYSFSGPETIPAGVVRLKLINEGREPHHLQLLKLAPGQTFDDFLAAVQADPDPRGLPEMLRALGQDAGGPNLIAPNREASATVNLEPGNYVIACFVPDHDGTPHILLGMVRGLQVTEQPGIARTEPTASLTIDMVDFAYRMPESIPAGTHTIRVNNQGHQYHEAALVRLAPGKSAQDFIAATHPQLEEERPGEAVGGMAGIAEGKHAFFSANFTPGTYALICYLPDIESDQFHFERGMVTEFTVE